MLNIDEIQNGLVIDHIKAGTAIGLMLSSNGKYRCLYCEQELQVKPE